MTLTKLAERADRELPGGWTIKIWFQRGMATLTLCDQWDMDVGLSHSGNLDQQFDAALKYLRDAYKKVDS